MEQSDQHDELIFEKNKIFPNLMTMENRGYYVHKAKSTGSLKIPGKVDDPRKISCWEIGIVRSACEDILARMNIADFQQIRIDKSLLEEMETSPRLPTIRKRFSLSSTAEEAAQILLNSHSTGSESREFIRIMVEQDPRKLVNPRYFLTKMAAVAWDFLNINSIFSERR